MKLRRQIQLICVMLSLLCLCACTGQKDSGIVQGRMGTGNLTEEKKQEIPDSESVSETEEILEDLQLYIVTKVDTNKKTVDFQKVTDGRLEQYSYVTGTRFLNKYGDSMAVSSLRPGDVAEIKASAKSGELTQLQLSGDVWVQDDIVNYSVNEDNHAFTIGKTKYFYDEGMELYSGDTKVRFSDLGESDVLRAVGIDKKIISLAVTRGHGYLALANTEIFEDSFICVGDKIFEQVTKNLKIEVPEGTHLVTVANNGYGGSREVTITRNRTTSLNLDELKGEGPKFCKIKFVVGVDGAVLKIDEEKIDYSKPVKVQYGVHTIAVSAEGYETITQKLVVNSKEAEIEIALTSASGTATDATDAGSKTENNTNTDNLNTNNNTNNSNNSNNTNSNSNLNNTNNNINNNSNNINNNINSNTNSNTGTNNNTENNSGTNNDSSSTDYLTTLYNLLTSINDSNSSSSSSSTTDSYDELKDQ